MLDSALFANAKMSDKAKFFLKEARSAHGRITNLLVLTNPLLVGAWTLRGISEPFLDLSGPQEVKDAIMELLKVPAGETSIRRMSLVESLKEVDWDRQKNSLGEMMLLICFSIFENFTHELSQKYFSSRSDKEKIETGFQFPDFIYEKDNSGLWSQKMSSYKYTIKDAISVVDIDQVMLGRVYKNFPMYNNVNLEDLFERQIYTYRMFKMYRNSIVHGNMSSDLIDFDDYVRNNFSKGALGVNTKVMLGFDNGRYYLDYYSVIGFLYVVLRIISYIDKLFLVSKLSEDIIAQRLKDHADSNQLCSANLKKETKRMKSILKTIGAGDVSVDEDMLRSMTKKGAWKYI